LSYIALFCVIAADIAQLINPEVNSHFHPYVFIIILFYIIEALFRKKFTTFLHTVAPMLIPSQELTQLLYWGQ